MFGWKVEVDGLVIAEGDDILPAVLGSSTSKDVLEENNRGKQRGWHPAAAAAAATSSAAHGVSEATAAAGVRKASGGGDDDSDSKGSVAKVVFGTPSLLLPGQECWLTVTGRLREATAWAAAGHVVGHTQLELHSEKVRVSSVPAVVLGNLFVAGSCMNPFGEWATVLLVAPAVSGGETYWDGKKTGMASPIYARANASATCAVGAIYCLQSCLARRLIDVG